MKDTMLRNKRSESALKRDNTNRIAALPRGKAHWRYTKKPSVLTLHKRIHRKHGPAKQHKCKCGKQAIDWAFIGNGDYTDKREDYKPMCRGCHMKMDGHNKNGNNNHINRKRDSKGKFI